MRPSISILFSKSDTKPLVAAAYWHETGKALRHTAFSGGAQVEAVFRRLAQQDSDFTQPFEDRLGELRNLSNEYDRIPRVWTDLRELGFSKWIPLAQYRDLKTGWLPDVHVIACADSQAVKISIVDKRLVYIGETVSQNIRTRLNQLKNSVEGKGDHSGGETLRGHLSEAFLWDMGSTTTSRRHFSLRKAHLERTLLYEYVHAVQAYPDGNSR